MKMCVESVNMSRGWVSQEKKWKRKGKEDERAQPRHGIEFREVNIIIL